MTLYVRLTKKVMHNVSIKVLLKRLAKFGLEVAVEKTNIIKFDRSSKLRFDFIGFEIYWDKNRWGKIVLKRRTSRYGIPSINSQFQGMV